MAYADQLRIIVLLLGFHLLGGNWVLAIRNISSVNFDQNYHVTWGYDHVSLFNDDNLLQLSMDKSTGSGFASKLSYGSGFFHLRIKLPDRNSAGVVTAFYLTSQGGNHDEVDFEFLGNLEGRPITLQTNVYANGEGDREQRIFLWFDPTADFHDYRFLWNHHQIVFYVDNVPIRVFKNNEKIGVSYVKHPMQIIGSLWDGENWATDGGQTKTNWSYAPFKAEFQEFDINGCSFDLNNVKKCYLSKYWWNSEKYWKLDPVSQNAYENVKKNYMYYDYCADRSRHSNPPPECLVNAN